MSPLLRKVGGTCPHVHPIIDVHVHMFDVCFVWQYLGYRTSAVSFEVDERYRRLGFEIEDSVGGRCRVLRHHALGSRPFVGCVFTTAPVTHPLIASLSTDQQLAASVSRDDDDDDE